MRGTMKEAASRGRETRRGDRPISRRDAVARLGLIAAAAAAGCTPLRIALRGYPESFETDPERVDRTLRAFVTAVIPGAPEDDPDLVRAFYDEELSALARYRNFLAADLSERAARRYGESRFHRLGLAERTRVIRDGLAADATTRRLYEGAIFLSQVACYSGIYDDEKGCPLIEFEGRFRPRPLAQLTYADPESYLAPPLTADGNYA